MSVVKRAQAAVNDFVTPKLLRNPVDVEIPQLRDDPAYAAATELLSAFTQRNTRLERERLRLILANDLNGRTPNPKSSSDRLLQARLELLSAEPPLQPFTPITTPSAFPEIALGMEVLNGKQPQPVRSHQEQMRDLDRQIAALDGAIRKQNEVVDEIAGHLHLEFSQRLRPAWNQLQVELFRAGQELARATKRVRDFTAAMQTAGIRPRSDVLAQAPVRSPLILGEETNWHSEIAGWRRALEQRGIL